MGNQVPGKLMVLRGNSQETISGGITAFEGANPQDVLAEIKTRGANPINDYFVFERPSQNPALAGKPTTFLMAVDARKFAAGNNTAQFKLFASGPSGLPIELQGLKFVGVVDNSWNYPVKIIEVGLGIPPGTRTATADEERARAVFEDLLAKKLKDKEAGVDDVTSAIEEAKSALRKLVFDTAEISLELVPDTNNPANKIASLKVKIVPAISMISFDGLPEAVIAEASEWMAGELKPILDTHPLVAPALPLSSKVSEYRLVPERNGSSIVWRYPADIPKSSTGMADRLRALKLTGWDREPALLPGAPMPIPGFLLAKLGAWLEARLERENGVYSLDTNNSGLTFGDCVSQTLHFEHAPHPEIRISRETVELAKEINTDLSAEMELLEKGTADWSKRRLAEFLEALRQKFREAGFQIDEGSLFTAKPQGQYELTPLNNISLSLESSSIRFRGDVNLPGIGGEAKLSKIVGQERLDQPKFREKLDEVRKFFHNAGYLLIGDNPLNPEGPNFLPVIPDQGQGIVWIEPRVVRTGKLSIAGKISDSSKEALIRQIGAKKGEVLKFDSFLSRTRIKLAELGLEMTAVPDFTQNADGTMDIVFHVKPVSERYSIGAGTNGETFAGTAAFVIPHKINGLSSLSVNGSMGTFQGEGLDGTPVTPLSGGLNISATLLPFNNGLSLSGGVGFSHSPYVLRTRDTKVAETGESERTTLFSSVTIPVGPESNDHSYALIPGVHGEVVNRRGKRKDGTSVSETTVYAGESIGVRALRIPGLVEGDIFKLTGQVGLDHNLSKVSGDATIHGILVYLMPVGKHFLFEAKAGFIARPSIYGGDLPVDRLIGPREVASFIDFGRDSFDPYSANNYLYSGLFLILSSIGVVEPAVGITLSRGTDGKANIGVGGVIRIPFFGIGIYLGHNGERWTTGISVSGGQEL